MSRPSTRQGLIDYCLRKLGYPVLEINVDDDQIDDLVDDAIQFFQERHYDGIERMFLKHIITQEEIDRAKGGGPGIGISQTTGTSKITGIGTTTFNFYENSNYLQVPDSVIGINNIFKFDTSSISSGMWSIKYQLFLNDLSDVDITTSTVSGSILVLNAQTGIYEATNVLYGGTY